MQFGRHTATQTSVFRNATAVERRVRPHAGRVSRWASHVAVSSLVLLLTACASDVADTATMARPASVATAPVTSPDGYPNVSVDTARAARSRPRDAVEQQKLERDLMALGAHTRARGSRDKPESVLDELKDLAAKNRKSVDDDRSVPGQATQ